MQSYKISCTFSDSRSLAFGGSKKKKGGGGGGQKKNANGSSGVDPTNNVDQKDFKDWADRDGERVRQEYESDLKDALLQSKISFEETKQVPPLPTGDGSQQSSSLTNGHDKKKKKAAAISLDEFNSLPSDRLQNLHLNGSAPPGPPGVSGGPFSPFGSGFGRSPEKDIFDQVAEDARKVLEREKRLEILQRSAVSLNHNNDYFLFRNDFFCSLFSVGRILTKFAFNCREFLPTMPFFRCHPPLNILPR